MTLDQIRTLLAITRDALLVVVLAAAVYTGYTVVRDAQPAPQPKPEPTGCVQTIFKPCPDEG